METARFSLMGQSRVKYMPSNKWQHLRLGGGVGGYPAGGFDLFTIIPLALMASESIAHEADNCFSKIQLVGKKYRE